jgi:aldehyde dehydrogenase (NAD+)
VNGQYSTPTPDQSKSLFVATNPFTGSPLANLIDCDESLVKSALASARNAFSAWQKQTYLQRGRLIYNIARNIQKNPSILIACESLNSGRTSREVKDLDVAAIVKTFYYYAGSVGSLHEIDLTKYSPLGVVAVCGHFDSPLLSICGKIAAALATGNTCVVIPHKLTPLSAYLLAEICLQSGIPQGVVNVISSGSDEIYRCIATGVDCITFDGKTNPGQEILTSDSFVKPNIRTLLSLEGKAALCIYEDSDVDSAVEAVVDGCFYANGMHRYSLNKVLVQECMYADVVQRLKTRFSKVKTGNHLDKCNDYGPVFDSKELRNILTKEVATNGAEVTEFRESNDGPKLTPPTIIENAALNSQFNLEEVISIKWQFINKCFF